jgi:signal transduction histidine kinase
LRFRPKLFLSFLALGLTPLMLLALVNYRSSVGLAEAALERNQERDLAHFTREISEFLAQDKNELAKLSRSKPLREYLESSSQNDAAVKQPVAASQPREPLTQANPSTIPVEVRLLVASVLNSRTYFSAISVFNANKQPLFVATQRESETYEPVDFQTKDFLSTQPKPDERVWTGQPGIWNSPISVAPSGAFTVITAPILSTGQETTRLSGALVAEVRLDPVFAEAAREEKGAAGAFANMFVVLDRSRQILYHTNEAVKNQPVATSLPYFLPLANQMISSESGKDSFIGANGDTYTTTYARLPALDVFVARASNHDQALSDARRTGIMSLVAAVLLGVLAATLLTLYWQTKSRGIERVSEGVEAIARGKLDHRIDLRSRDDLKPLADNVELMTRQLREQIARETESRQFQSFVRLSAILTHDLKNAIEALSLTVSNMERHFENAEFRADAMKTLRGATENLRALVARLSNPVTTLSGEHKLPRAVDLVPMLRRVISMTAGTESGPHKIEIKLPESLFALVDVERMDKVVENLIINAREAMLWKNGMMTIEAGTTAEGKPFFSVSDTGEGMSRRFIEERLFHPFATTKKRGVGLGLYTCREVVRANGGSIKVNSEEGVGTTFLVVLPSAPTEKGQETVSKIGTSTHRQG